MCDRQGLSLTVGLKRRSTTAPGRRGSPSPSRKVLRAGTATGRPAGQSPTTGPGCYRAWPRKPSSCAPRSSSAPLRTTSIAAACAGHGCAGARTCTSDTCSHVAGHNLSLLMRKLIGAGTPAGRPWRADMALFACLLRQLEPFWSLRWSSSSRRMAKPPSSRYVSPSSETRSIAPFFNGAVRLWQHWPGGGVAGPGV